MERTVDFPVLDAATVTQVGPEVWTVRVVDPGVTVFRADRHEIAP